eukprot:gb/GEZN01001301.1/.p1 GENE.gb/GEZN01001301.1/~~gb/GEZN01001301.1/.p1  ORF type:complete len:892 (+),score=82.55 gb/GEZN01001301.1/:154-2829(+)
MVLQRLGEYIGEADTSALGWIQTAFTAKGPDLSEAIIMFWGGAAFILALQSFQEYILFTPVILPTESYPGRMSVAVACLAFSLMALGQKPLGELSVAVGGAAMLCLAVGRSKGKKSSWQYVINTWSHLLFRDIESHLLIIQNCCEILGVLLQRRKNFAKPASSVVLDALNMEIALISSYMNKVYVATSLTGEKLFVNLKTGCNIEELLKETCEVWQSLLFSLHLPFRVFLSIAEDVPVTFTADRDLTKKLLTEIFVIMTTKEVPNELVDVVTMDVGVIETATKEDLVNKWKLRLKNKEFRYAMDWNNFEAADISSLSPLPKRKPDKSILGLAVVAVIDVMEANQGHILVERGQHGKDYIFLFPLFTQSTTFQPPEQWLCVHIQFAQTVGLAERFTEIPLTCKEDAVAIVYPISFLADEIRNPVSVLEIIGHEMQECREIKNGSEIASDILAASDFINATVNDVLTWVKSDLHEFKLDCVPFDIVDVLKILKNQWERQLISKGGAVELRVHLDETIPKIVYGDPVRLKHIVWNLFANALKFTTKGTITFTAKPFTGQYLEGGIKIVERAPNVVMSKQALAFQEEFIMMDTGLGVDQANFFKLMKPFAQIHTIDQAQSGVGLGMAIVGKLVRLMLGELLIKSSEGTGCTFQLIIPFSCKPTKLELKPLILKHKLRSSSTLEPLTPIASSPQPAPLSTISAIEVYEAPLVESSRLSPVADKPFKLENPITKEKPLVKEPSSVSPTKYDMEVLIVNENVTILKMMSRRLERLVTKVSTASNGLQAVNMLRSRLEAKLDCPDLIIMDLQMSKMHGYETMQTIRDIKCKSRIVVLSSVPRTENFFTEVVAHGASDLFNKPMTQDDLLKVIQEVSHTKIVPKTAKSRTVSHADKQLTL